MEICFDWDAEVGRVIFHLGGHTIHLMLHVIVRMGHAFAGAWKAALRELDGTEDDTSLIGRLMVLLSPTFVRNGQKRSQENYEDQGVIDASGLRARLVATCTALAKQNSCPHMKRAQFPFLRPTMVKRRETTS